MERKKAARRRIPKTQFSKEYETLIAHEKELRGKYVVIVDDQVFTAATGKGASKLLAQVRRKFPEKTPLATYLPKAETLILWL